MMTEEMKICLIIDDYLPDSIKVGAKMMHELAIEFIRRGHGVTVITPYVNLKNRSSVTLIDGVHICYFRSGPIKNVSKVKRALNETLLSHNAWRCLEKYFRNNPHDLIIYYSPSIFWGSLVSRLKKLWDAPSYLILRDLFPQWVIDNGMLSESSLITKYFRYFEKLNYQAADTIALQSPKSLERYKEIGNITKHKHLDVLYNWAANKSTTPHNCYFRQKYGLDEKIVYFYGGNIGHAQDMMNVIRLAKRMRSKSKAHFLLVGKGDEFEMVRAAIEESKLLNVTLLPPVSQDEYNYMLAEFDVGLFTLHKDHTTHNFPGKLLAYMVHEKPILGSINSGNDLKPIVENAQAGLITINGDDEIFDANALKLLNDDSYRKNMGRNAKKLLIDVFSVESAADSILRVKEK